MRLWIDTDVGTNVDDAVALLVALAHPAVDLVGVSIVGDEPLRRAGVAIDLLASSGRYDIPVVAGPPDAVAIALAAVEPDALLAIGPLTNVAAALGAGVDLPPITVMGGALRPVRHRGAVRAIEWNFSRDPPAAAVTVATAQNLTIVPLDATVATRLGERAREQLVGAVPVLQPMVEQWLAAQRSAGVPPDEAAVHLHDPAALLVAAGEDERIGVRRERRRLAVMPDGRLVEDADGALREVVTAVNGPAVVERVSLLLGGSP